MAFTSLLFSLIPSLSPSRCTHALFVRIRPSGSPQRWAIKAGYGAALIQRPELVHSMVRSLRAITNIPVSVKIRVQEDLTKTVELVRQAEAAGVSFITVHGRTVTQKKEPVNRDAIALVTNISAQHTAGERKQNAASSVGPIS